MNFLMCFTQTAAGHRKYLLWTICINKKNIYFKLKFSDTQQVRVRTLTVKYSAMCCWVLSSWQTIYQIRVQIGGMFRCWVIHLTMWTHVDISHNIFTYIKKLTRRRDLPDTVPHCICISRLVKVKIFHHRLICSRRQHFFISLGRTSFKMIDQDGEVNDLNTGNISVSTVKDYSDESEHSCKFHGYF